MCVKDPAPRNAFLPRSMPGTAFGPSTRVPGGVVIFQDGKLKEITNFQPSALAAEELRFIELHLKDWDTPVAPAAPPTSEGWDARRAPQPQEEQQSVVSGNQLLPAPTVEELPAGAPLREEAPEDPRIRSEELAPPEPADLPPPEPADPHGHAFDFEPFGPEGYVEDSVAAAARATPAGEPWTRLPRSGSPSPGGARSRADKIHLFSGMLDHEVRGHAPRSVQCRLRRCDPRFGRTHHRTVDGVRH